MDVWLRVERPVDAEADIPMQDEASERIKSLYAKEEKGAFIVWSDSSEGTLGCIKNNRSIALPIQNVAGLVLSQMEPAKGPGFVALSFVSKDGKELAGIHSSRCSRNAVAWLSSIQPVMAEALNLEQKTQNLGCDA